MLARVNGAPSNFKKKQTASLPNGRKLGLCFFKPRPIFLPFQLPWMGCVLGLSPMEASSQNVMRTKPTQDHARFGGRWSSAVRSMSVVILGSSLADASRVALSHSLPLFWVRGTPLANVVSLGPLGAQILKKRVLTWPIDHCELSRFLARCISLI